MLDRLARTPGLRLFGLSHRVRHVKLKVVIACAMSILAAFATAAPALADCINAAANDAIICPDHNGNCGLNNEVYLAQVGTQSTPCHWTSPPTNWHVTCNFVYSTLGGKGNLSTGGNPFVYTSAEHVLEWITAEENPAHCRSLAVTGAVSCWVQVGWEVGHSQSCGGTIDASSPMVEVELYDDSNPTGTASTCLLTTFGAAPSNASYDARFYSTLPNGLHRYQVYFEVPGSGNIQNLAFADFADLDTAEEAAGEAHPVVTSGTPFCPTLGQTTIGEWNVDGQAASQATFASNMQLYTGSWVNWTTAVAQTYGYIWPPNGTDVNGYGDSKDPYQIQAISNWAAGDYTEWESGGPH